MPMCARVSQAFDRGGLARPRDGDERALELEIDGETRSALDGVVEHGQADDRFAKLVRAVVPRLRVELLDVERIPLQPGGRFSRAQAFVCEQLAVPNPADVRDE